MASVDTEDDQLLSVIYGDHEPDDWAAKHQISLSEHASRLNAKQHFDNRGRQIWTDGAEEVTVQWHVNTGAGGAVARSLLCAWRGAASVQLSNAGGGLDLSGLMKRFYNPETGRYGFEVAWSADHAVLGRTEIYVNIHDGVNFYGAAIGYDGVLGTYYYLNAGGILTTLIQPVSHVADIHFWHKMKLVIDVDNLEYLRVLIDGVEHNLTGQGLRPLGASANIYIQVWLTQFGPATNAVNLYLDDFIFTHLEP